MKIKFLQDQSLTLTERREIRYIGIGKVEIFERREI